MFETTEELNQLVELPGSPQGSVFLEMVLIPQGTFTMGSPEKEEGRIEDEGPQHEVTISPFFMGKYPITQDQWRVVAALPRVERELPANPSRFNYEEDSDRRPVEQITWYQAVEFCARLTKATGREYRLPSEAEWEYACRAGTTTPFHFGETISSDLANCRGDRPYNNRPQGEYRKETTPVGNFPANAFGLYDMHGNVWEWCADHWHNNYKGAPPDNTVRLSSDEGAFRVLRGGSWVNNPELCRSAMRYRNIPDFRYNWIGLRVVCAAAGLSQEKPLTANDEGAFMVLRGGSWSSNPKNCRSTRRFKSIPDRRSSRIGLRVVCAAAG